MDIIAWIFLVVTAYTVIMKFLISQFGGEPSSESPFKSVIKIVFAATLIGLRPQVMQGVAYLFQRVKQFAMPSSMVQINSLGWWLNLNPEKVFLRTVLICMVAFGVVGAALSYLERIFTFLLFAYTYPIAIAFSVNQDTSDMFRQWLIGVISQIIVIAFSSGMMYIAISLMNAATSMTLVESLTPILLGDSVHVFEFFLAINAMNLVKNSEKILNMYNIRTMPNQDTAKSFGAAIGTAMAVGGKAINLTGKAMHGASEVGSVLTGSATGPVGPGGGFDGGNMINPSGVSESVTPSGADITGGNKAQEIISGTSNTNEAKIKTAAEDYATRISIPKDQAAGPGASDAEKLQIGKAQVPSSAQKMQESLNRGLFNQGGNVHTLAGKATQAIQGGINNDKFSKNVDATIGDINNSRSKVNDWIDEQSNLTREGTTMSYGDKEGQLKAEDVYKAYGMSNDSGLKNFKPEGYAVPVVKDGKMTGMMIKGKQTNTRTGETAEKQLYVSTDNARKSKDNTIGAEGEWTVDNKSGFHQLTPDVYAYDVKKTKVATERDGSPKDPDTAHFQAENQVVTQRFMETGSWNAPTANSHRTYPANDISPEQPDPVALQKAMDAVPDTNRDGDKQPTVTDNAKDNSADRTGDNQPKEKPDKSKNNRKTGDE